MGGGGQCPPGYTLNGGRCCQGSVCNTPPTCPPGQVFNPISGCINIGPCAPGWTLNASGLCCLNGTCIPPPSFVLACTPQTVGQSCQVGGGPSNPGVCVTNQGVVQCQGSNPAQCGLQSGCATCTSTGGGATQCTSCVTGLTLSSGGQCTCPNGQSPNSNGQCPSLAQFVSFSLTPSSTTLDSENGRLVLRAGHWDDLPINQRVPGVAFVGQASVDQNTPAGTLEFVQFTTESTRITFTDGSALVATSNAVFELDTVDPYPTLGSSQVGNLITINTDDSPNLPIGDLPNTLIGPLINFVTRVAISDQYSMYLAFAPNGGTRYTLGKATWSWSPIVSRNSSGQLTVTSGRQISASNGVSDSTTLPTNPPSICSLTWTVDNSQSTQTPSIADLRGSGGTICGP